MWFSHTVLQLLKLFALAWEKSRILKPIVFLRVTWVITHLPFRLKFTKIQIRKKLWSKLKKLEVFLRAWPFTKLKTGKTLDLCNSNALAQINTVNSPTLLIIMMCYITISLLNPKTLKTNATSAEMFSKKMISNMLVTLFRAAITASVFSVRINNWWCITEVWTNRSKPQRDNLMLIFMTHWLISSMTRCMVPASKS